ncbi:N-acetylmuramoyl-L-alanine amidase [Streptomyces avermitilis]|uniref:N-acetylmuramoyl-L-alanine amidase n=1 Tax=Streptomyces avermitilis TaxID=33903 RepID=UPI00371F9DBD
MRGYLANSIGVTCAVALVLPLALTAPAQARPSASATGSDRAGSATDVAGSAADRAGTPVATEATVPGSTQSLPLAPLSGTRAVGAAAEQGLTPRDVRRFSLVGVVWNDPATELHGRVQVRTRADGTTHWSGWQDVETHSHEHAPDPDTAEGSSRRARGSTAPLWVGDSDGVEVRVRAEGDRAPAPDTRALPGGLRLELVDPGAQPPAGAPKGSSRAGLATLADTEIPALSKEQTERELMAEQGSAPRTQPYIGPRPRIITRHGWGADESLRARSFVYTSKVKAAFVHHTASGNKYTCSQAPSVIRGIYRYHVLSSGWRDIGYNFLVDKCGNIYEGRAGGVTKAVMGAHTLGFNSNSMGIAVLGTFSSTKPAAAAVNAIAKLTAWKLGLYGADPRGKTYLKSAGGNLYRKGKNVRLNVISGHRDGFATECPGKQLYGKLGSARSTSARFQGR